MIHFAVQNVEKRGSPKRKMEILMKNEYPRETE